MLSIESIFGLIYENKLQITLFVVFLGLVQHFIKSYLSLKRLPLGPFGLPFVGYLPFMGNDAHRTIAKLGQKYGNVFT